jgi:hypothetical protein
MLYTKKTTLDNSAGYVPAELSMDNSANFGQFSGLQPFTSLCMYGYMYAYHQGCPLLTCWLRSRCRDMKLDSQCKHMRMINTDRPRIIYTNGAVTACLTLLVAVPVPENLLHMVLMNTRPIEICIKTVSLYHYH